MDGEAFKRRLVHSVMYTAFESFIASVLKYEDLNENLKCVYITMCPLVMSSFSRDLLLSAI